MSLKEKNELVFQKFSGLRIFIRQLKNPLLYVLLFATGTAFYLGERTNSLVIIIMMGVSLAMGFWNEYAAEKTIADLLNKISLTTLVLRNGHPLEIAVRDVVVGDVVLLSSGSIIPADLVLQNTQYLEVDEAILTGESLPVIKKENDLSYMGTLVISGKSQGIVTAIGKHTRFGQISANLTVSRPETEFQKGLTQYSYLLVKIITVMSVFLFLVNYLLGHPPIDSLLFSVAIAVGLTPELFPVIVTVSLAYGARKMAKHQVVVKQLIAIENLGNMEILCTDKTGTLTEGKIVLRDYLDASGQKDDRVLTLALLCNSEAEHSKSTINNIDTAILHHASENRFQVPEKYHTVMLSPFSFDLRAMFSVVKSSSGLSFIAKGSPEAILLHCRITSDQKRRILSQIQSFNTQGIRVVAVAEKKVAPQKSYSFADIKGLSFTGLLTFQDIPQPQATKTLKLLENLGVRIKVITGDNEVVTQHICEKVGVPSRKFILGEAIAKLSDAELAAVAPQMDFFARVSPDQKVRIIHALQLGGHTVGFLGDGTNDAPALHEADCGISVNNAVDVAKDTASIVLLSKNLNTIAEGIMEGRKTFANTLKYVLMGTSSNFGNMFSAAAASFVLPFLPMTASQILLTNLLYDFSQLAVPTDNIDPEDLHQPKKWDLGLIKRYMYIFGPLSSLFDFATFGIMIFVFKANAALFQTGWFVESLITEVLVIFLIRTRRSPFFRSRPGSILTITSLSIVSIGIALTYSRLGSLLGFVPLPPLYFSIVIGFTLSYLFIVETVKYYSKII